MLKPEYFNDKADRMIELYQELENFILQDIAKRLLKSQSVSGTADRLIWKLEQMGESRAEIMNKLSQLTGLSRRELKALLQDAVMTSWDDDLSTFNMMGVEVVNPLDNPAVMSVMDVEYKKCQGELENLTRTTIDQSQKDLIKMLDEAEIRVASGIKSYSSAICSVLDDYAKKGMVIDYPTGTKRSLEAAVRCCIVTSMNQTCAQITNQYIVEGGVEYVLVSAHLGARIQQSGQPYLAGHENWQGKVYRIRGSESDCLNLLEQTGYDIDESGSGKVVNPLGLHGYNCRHSHKPWDKSLRNPYVDENGNPVIDTEESCKLYENQQKQRAMERAIRKTKRELLMKQAEIDSIAEIDVKKIIQEDYDRLAYKLRQQNTAYNEFCEKKGLQKQSDRLKVAGFKRAQASKASGRARAYEQFNMKYNGMPSEWLETKGQKMSMKLEVINPNKSMENCASGVVAYEMRQRGINIIARDEGIKVLMKEPWKAWENIEPIEDYSKNDIIELIKTEKGNCRYELAFDYAYGSHCIVAEKYGDTISFVDPQLGVRYNADEYKTEMSNIHFWKISDANVSKEGVKGCKILK